MMNEQAREMMNEAQRAVNDKVSAYEREKRLQSTGMGQEPKRAETRSAGLSVSQEIALAISSLQLDFARALVRTAEQERTIAAQAGTIGRLQDEAKAAGGLTEQMARHHYDKGSADGHSEGYRLGYDAGRKGLAECQEALKQAREESATARQSAKDMTRSRDIVSKRLDEVRNYLSHIGAHVAQAREV
jgi:flagellar biosynthesis/type III secretory pathway protein FliH